MHSHSHQLKGDHSYAPPSDDRFKTSTTTGSSAAQTSSSEEDVNARRVQTRRGSRTASDMFDGASAAALGARERRGSWSTAPHEAVDLREACVRALASFPTKLIGRGDAHAVALTLSDAVTSAAMQCPPLLAEALLNCSPKVAATIGAVQQVRAYEMSVVQLARVTFSVARALLSLIAKGADKLYTDAVLLGRVIDQANNLRTALTGAVRCVDDFTASGTDLLKRVLAENERSAFAKTDRLLRDPLKQIAFLVGKEEEYVEPSNYAENVITMDELQQMGGVTLDTLKERIQSVHHSNSAPSRILELSPNTSTSTRSLNSQEITARSLRANLLVDLNSPNSHAISITNLSVDEKLPHIQAAIQARERADKARSAAGFAKQALETATEEARIARAQSSPPSAGDDDEMGGDSPTTSSAATAATGAMEAGMSGRGTIQTDTSDYVGGMMIQRMHGHGVLFISEAEDWYYGHFEHGRMQGFGVLYEGGGGTYEGEIMDDDYHGVGVYRFANGERYEGEFASSLFCGYGCYYWPSGERFDGTFRNDKRNGWGVLIDQKGRIHRRGLWSDDIFTTGIDDDSDTSSLLTKEDAQMQRDAHPVVSVAGTTAAAAKPPP